MNDTLSYEQLAAYATSRLEEMFHYAVEALKPLLEEERQRQGVVYIVQLNSAKIENPDIFKLRNMIDDIEDIIIHRKSTGEAE